MEKLKSRAREKKRKRKRGRKKEKERVYENERLRGGKDGARGCQERERQEKAAAAGGSGTAEDEGGGGVHCGFIPANTFIMADLAEPVTHCPGYISAFIPTLTFSLLCPLPLHRLISIPTESSPLYPVFCKTSLFQ